MELIDTHAHIYDKNFQDKISSLITRSQKSDIQSIYMPNIDLHTIQPMLHLATSYPNYCYPMLGLHPCYVKKNYQTQLAKIAEWLPKYPLVAIGEIGIDLYHSKSTKKYQIEALKIQLQWAIDYKLPAILHCRESIDEVIAILSEVKNTHSSLKGIMHCFTGTHQQAKKVIDLGFYLGIGGIVTYLKNNPLKTLIPLISLENIVLETDSPYLAPIPHRGERNQPAYLTYIAQEVATLKNTSIEQVARLSTQNARSVFSSTT